MTAKFEIAGINRFVDDAHKILPPHDNRFYSWAGMQGLLPTGRYKPYLPDVLEAVLQLYDAEPLTPSLVTPGGEIIPKSYAWNAKGRLIATPLWEHVLGAGRIYLEAAIPMMKETKDLSASGMWLTLIAIVSHDLGKLRSLRPGNGNKYESRLHPEYGANALESILPSGLSAYQKRVVMDAVMNHHELYKVCEKKGEWMTTAVIKADRLARGIESDPDPYRYFQKALQQFKPQKLD